MKEAFIRKWHRRMGITLALFIILQAGTGLLLSLDWFDTAHSHAHGEKAAESSKAYNQPNANQEMLIWHEAMEFIHHGASATMKGYRILLGFGLIAMAVTGISIFYKIKSRTKQ